jgi:hypothetical protein
MTLVEQIAGLELVKIQYRLKIFEPFHFEPEMILHWRKELVRGALRAAEIRTEDPLQFNALIDPSPADDPYAQRQFQKPAPLFIVDPINLHAKDYVAGEIFPLEILFPGEGVRHAATFARILIGLGEIGIFKGEGSFEVDSCWAMPLQGGWQSVWAAGDALDQVSMPILDVQWLIDKKGDAGGPFQLKFVTPARLLKKGRPLFRADFGSLFPFALRRVTSVLYSCSQMELNLDAPRLINDAQAVGSINNCLTWEDWRHLNADHGTQGVGGVTGTLQMAAGLPEDIYIILRLAELFNIGKGASYGAGCFVLDPDSSAITEKR